MSQSLKEVAIHIGLSERRVQQLAKAGIIPKTEHGVYPLIECVSGYIQYLKRGQRQSDIYCTRTQLTRLGVREVWLRQQVRHGVIKKLSHGRYDVGGCIQILLQKIPVNAAVGDAL